MPAQCVLLRQRINVLPEVGRRNCSTTEVFSDARGGLEQREIVRHEVDRIVPDDDYPRPVEVNRAVVLDIGHR